MREAVHLLAAMFELDVIDSFLDDLQFHRHFATMNQDGLGLMSQFEGQLHILFMQFILSVFFFIWLHILKRLLFPFCGRRQ